MASLKITGVPNVPGIGVALQLWLREKKPEFGAICDLQVLRHPGGKYSDYQYHPKITVAYLTYEHNNSHAYAWVRFNGAWFGRYELNVAPHGFTNCERNRAPRRYRETTLDEWRIWCRLNDIGPAGPGSFHLFEPNSARDNRPDDVAACSAAATEQRASVDELGGIGAEQEIGERESLATISLVGSDAEDWDKQVEAALRSRNKVRQAIGRKESSASRVGGPDVQQVSGMEAAAANCVLNSSTESLRQKSGRDGNSGDNEGAATASRESITQVEDVGETEGVETVEQLSSAISNCSLLLSIAANLKDPLDALHKSTSQIGHEKSEIFRSLRIIKELFAQMAKDVICEVDRLRKQLEDL